MDYELDISGVNDLVIVALNELTHVIDGMSNNDERKQILISQRSNLWSVVRALQNILSQ
jgi:hypothetical protein